MFIDSWAKQMHFLSKSKPEIIHRLVPMSSQKKTDFKKGGGRRPPWKADITESYPQTADITIKHTKDLIYLHIIIRVSKQLRNRFLREPKGYVENK